MDTLRESGHYAIAGFLYQLLASGVEAIEVCSELLGDQEPREVLLLERFGQDAVALPTDARNTKPRLIQYKFSSKTETIAPSEFREILQAFLKSVQSQGFDIDQVEYKLVTNRGLSRDAKKWDGAIEESELAELISASSQSDLADAQELARIYQVLEYDQQTTGARFGMLKSEIDARIDQLVGLLMRKAGRDGGRIVRPEEIHETLTGYANPYELLSGVSVELRREEVARYKNDETDGQETIPRTVSAEIAMAVLEHPVVVVVGNGGSGKSVAVADAVASGLQVVHEPPGFGLVLPALHANADAVMQSIARWRNLPRHQDGQLLEQSLSRLRVAFAHSPLLVTCIDAIDGKENRARLPEDVRRLILDLIDRAVSEREKHGTPAISVILTCRRIIELKKLSRGGIEFPYRYHRIDVSDFAVDEIRELAARLDRDIRERITHHFQMRSSDGMRPTPTTARPVSSGVMANIAHPVIWRFFSALNVQAQHACLDGLPDGFDQIATSYLDWFCEKAEIRVNSLMNDESRTALAAVAQRFQGDSGRKGDRETDWVTPCVSAGSPRLHAHQLFSEAMTAGILAEDESGGKRWHWRHRWFCEYLLRQQN
jgi:hypothetical protein